jgi:ABC-2 type transport system permease protein
MNNQSTTAPESFLQPRGLSPATESAARAFFWAIRRELWENRSLYIAPLIAATVFLFAFLVSLFSLRHRVSSSQLNSAQLRDALTTQLDLAAALIMGTAFVVGIFYTLDALYGERRDRSILFWKSLPVSDLTTVLSKFTIPIVVVPMVSFAITLLTQFCMLLLSSVVLAGIGAEVGTVWTGPFLRDSSALFYHLLTIHGFWYAPLYAWLLLVSAWAPRLPFLWAFLPPFVICGLEKMAFNSTRCLQLVQYRLLGPGGAMAPEHHRQDFMATLIPPHFFSTPGLWTGLVVAAALLFLTVRVRRYRGPI